MRTEVRRGRKFVEYVDDSLPVGTFVQEIGVADVSYHDDNSVWQPIDENWETDGLDGFSFRAQRMNHKVRFDSIGAWRWYPRRNVETEYIIINRPKCWLTRTNRWGNLLVNGISREGRDITLTSLWNVTRVIHSRWNGIKTDWILENADAPTRFQQQIDLVGLTEVDGWLYGADGEQVARLTPTIAIDAEGNELPVSTSYENGILEFSADVTGAVFPVVIDPDFVVQPDGTAGMDTYITSSATNTNYGASSEFNIQYGGGWWGRGLIQFDLSTLAGKTIVSAVQYYTAYANATSTATTYMHRILSGNAWTELGATYNTVDGTNAWAGSAGCNTSGTDFSATAIGTNSSKYTANTEYSMDLDVTEFTAMVAANYGCVVFVTASWTQKKWHSSDALVASYRPRLVVTYTAGSNDYTLTCAAGSYSLTGTDCTLTHTPASQNLTLACSAGSYSLTGTNADLTVTRHYTLTCEAGSYALTGTNADLTVKRNYVLACSAGNYLITGTDATLTVQRNYTLVCESGSYLLTGTDAGIVVQRNYTFVCEPGSYLLTGTDVDIVVQRNYMLVCEPGSYLLTGTDIDIVVQRNYTLVCEPGSYLLTGSIVNLSRNLLFPCSAGSYLLTGTDVTINFNYIFAFGAGSYVLIGTPCKVIVLWPTTPESRTFIIEREDRSFIIEREDRTLVIERENRTLIIDRNGEDEVKCEQKLL